jgi:4-diphosphocytidyl-2-C-methyl-D-erythritol kinase
VTLEVLAPAKLNLCLEVLRRRDDGYHEIASVMQTIDLADRVRLSHADALELVMTGENAGSLPQDEKNLALKAARDLALEVGRPDLGARIEMEKRIPAAMGLGGGSSDAAAVLRGLNRLWGLNLDEASLMRVAAGIGSDVPFFLHCGTALAGGRGEIIEPLPDHPPVDYALFLSQTELEDKTRRMYAQVRPSDFTDGWYVERAAAAARPGFLLSESPYFNVFDRHIGGLASKVGEAIEYCRAAGVKVVLTGSGPAFFAPLSLARVPTSVVRRLAGAYGITAVGCSSLSRADALAMRET